MKTNRIFKRTIFVVLVVWCDVTSHKQLSALSDVLMQKNCVGMIGGAGDQAYYIYGTLGNGFLILDPHDVKVSEEIT